MKYAISHADIVVTHRCNMNCKYCIDTLKVKFDEKCKELQLNHLKEFLILLSKNTTKTTDYNCDTNPNLEILFLGGEPTLIGSGKLIAMANLIKSYGFQTCLSTNGTRKNIIEEILPFFDWVQITVRDDKEIDYWRKNKDKINIKIVGDEYTTMEKLIHFEEYTKDFARRSVTMYFKPDFAELCENEQVLSFLDSLQWERLGSYYYAFNNGVRYKRCVKGVSNLEDEPLIPKLYPNGFYNKTWKNETYDPYLGELR